jgi:hypothetical protein
MKKNILMLALVACFTITSGCWKVDRRVMATPQIQMAGTDKSFVLKSFSAKALYVEDKDLQWYQSASDNVIATVQWRADLVNVSTKTARYNISIVLRDKDNFGLGRIDLSSDLGYEDIEPNGFVSISGEEQMKLGAIRYLARVEVFVTALPSKAEMEHAANERIQETIRRYREEVASKEQDKLRAEEEKRKAEEVKRNAEEAKRIAAAQEEAARLQAYREQKAKWDSIKEGMTKQQIESILGRATKSDDFRWFYGQYGYVQFGVFGTVTGWNYQ